MLEFLRETDVAPAFRRERKKVEASVIAVPFWGDGAIETLGLGTGSTVRVLCNLDHPGCNPDVIAELRRLRIKVRTHPRLHAKIYATPLSVIIGSSNASTNGLTVEGPAARGWFEGNVLSDDPKLVAKALAFFEDVWDHPDGRTVRATDIKTAQKARADRLPPSPRFGVRAKTLLAACRERPEAFANVFVAAYDEGLGPNANRVLRELKSGALPPRGGIEAGDFRKAWGYGFGRIPEGAWLIDLDCKRQDSATVWGSAQATGLRMKPKGEGEMTIALRRPVTLGGKVLRISAAEKAELQNAATKILAASRDDDELVPLTKAIAIIDGTKSRPATRRAR